MKHLLLPLFCLALRAVLPPPAAGEPARLLRGESTVAGSLFFNGGNLTAVAVGQPLPPATHAGAARLASGVLTRPAPPAGLLPPWLSIEAAGPDLLLSWSTVPGAAQYRVYSSQSWFPPGGGVLLQATADTSWTDAGQAAFPGRRTYRVSALSSTPSIRRLP